MQSVLRCSCLTRQVCSPSAEWMVRDGFATALVSSSTLVGVVEERRTLHASAESEGWPL